MNETENLSPEVLNLIDLVCEKIDKTPTEEIRADFKQLVCSLIKFVGAEESRILDKNIPSDETGKLFFKMIGNIAMEAVTAQISGAAKKRFNAKIAGILELHPLLIKYSDVQ